MATKTTSPELITFPQDLFIDATDGAKKFIPYKENFVTPVAKGDVYKISVYTLGQYLYYIKQGFMTAAEAAEKSVTATYTIYAPAQITITNNTDKVMNFIPYRENFSYSLAAGAAISFVSKTAGQTLYYMAQDTNEVGVEGGLDVDQVEYKGTEDQTVTPDAGA